ncbi:unnamed protein product [Calypogeia fissa]
MQMQKKGLEDIKQVNYSYCPSCSCGSCWQACLNCYCFYCSQEVKDVEDISSPRNFCGKRKAPPAFQDEELAEFGHKKTCWRSPCSSCCRKRKKRKRELACNNEPEIINLDDFDPTLVFEKKKALEDHDQVPYRQHDDVTLLDYLEAGWPVQEEPQQGSRCSPFSCCKKNNIDTKQKAKANSSCCTSPCSDKKKEVDLDNFKKIDNSLALSSTKQKAKENISCCKSPCGNRKKGVEVKHVEKINNVITIAGDSSGTLVWDKPPLIGKQDLFSIDQLEATLVTKNSQIHENVLFNQGPTVATPVSKNRMDGERTPPMNKAPKTGQLPQGWSWLVENSTNTPKTVDKRPDVQTRFVHIIPEIVDTRFQLKANDDMDISEKKEKNFTKELKNKEREDDVETSLVQFAKPEIGDKRFQLKSKDDVFQKKEENFQIIEEDVERLGVIHNKLGILQQQLLQKEQILLLEDRLKEQVHFQRRKEELALEKEQLEILREKIQGRGHLERNIEDVALEKGHLALLREVMNEKDQLERKKEEIIMEKKQLEMLQEELCQKQKEDLNLEKQEIEALQRQLSLEEKGRLKVKEQEIAIEREKLEILRDKLICKEKVQLEIKKEDLSLQLEKTKEELAREKEQFKAMQESFNSQERVLIEKSKVQLAYEKNQLEELREKLHLKEKDELKKRTETLDNVLMQLGMPSKNLSSKEMTLFERKNDTLVKEKEPFELFLGTNSDPEKDKFARNKIEDHSNGSVGDQKSKYDRKNSSFIPSVMQLQTSVPANTEKRKSKKSDSSSMANNCGLDFKTIALPRIKFNQEPSEELFEIENKRQLGEILEFTRSSEKKGQQGIGEKRYKGKKHSDLDLDEQLVDCIKKVKQGVHMKSEKKDNQVGQIPKGGTNDDDKKRPRAVLESDEHDNLYKFFDLKGQPKSSEVELDDGGDNSRKLHQSPHEDDFASRHRKNFDCGPSQARFQDSCTKVKQLLSYNFEPPKKRSDLGPQKKKAKKSDKTCFVPPIIPPPCVAARLDFPGRFMLNSCNKAAECFNQPHGQNKSVLEHLKKDEKKASNVKMIMDKIEKPRVKARFRFRGSLDEGAQNKLLGKLKELELQDLRATLADKQKLLKKLERSGMSISRKQKTP